MPMYLPGEGLSVSPQTNKGSGNSRSREANAMDSQSRQSIQRMRWQGVQVTCIVAREELQVAQVEAARLTHGLADQYVEEWGVRWGPRIVAAFVEASGTRPAARSSWNLGLPVRGEDVVANVFNLLGLVGTACALVSGLCSYVGVSKSGEHGQVGEALMRSGRRG